MKLLKKILLADEIDGHEMNLLRGGIQARANNNESTGCKCTGSSNSHVFCNDNTNKASSCSCSGNGDNSNSASSCDCQGSNDNSNSQTSCVCS